MTVPYVLEALSDVDVSGRLAWAIAYLGRYASQPRSEVLAMTRREINQVTEEVSNIIQEEQDSSRTTMNPE